jgi:hypothetical protein
MTSRSADDAPCKGCPDLPYPPAPEVPVGMVPNLEDTYKGLPEGTTSELKLPEGVITSGVWAVHQGFHAEDHLAQIYMTLPEGFTRVDIYGDGSIEYKKKPDDFESPGPIDGYVRDPENPFLFRPLWESCEWRYYTTVLKVNCQCIDVIARCSVNSHWVRYADCIQCKCRLPIKKRPNPVLKTRQNLRLPDLDRNSK